MMRIFAISLAGLLALLTACAPQSSGSFDPDDPEVVAIIDSLMAITIQASRAVDPVRVLEPMGGGEDFTVVTGNVILSGLESVQEAFTDTYQDLQKQDQTAYETRTRLLTPDVAVYTAVGEGTYTDLAGWTSDPVGIGLTVIFVRENGRWVGRYIHQSIER
jgi:uncharacterized protein (TIGR02246 family)